MKILAVANQKGGVGKTTLTLHIAQFAAKQGLRVLMVDFDNQGSLSLYFKATEGLEASKLFLSDALVMPFKVTEKLSIVRADDDLLAVDKANNSIIKVPKKSIAPFAQDYDLCVIDTAGVLGVRMTAALAMADYVVTPVSVGLFELSAVAGLLKTIHQVKTSGINPRLKHVGILPMKTNGRSGDEMRGLNELRNQYGAAIMPHVLTERAAVKNAVAARRPVWESVRNVSHRKAATEWTGACTAILQAMGFENA